MWLAPCELGGPQRIVRIAGSGQAGEDRSAINDGGHADWPSDFGYSALRIYIMLNPLAENL